MKITIDFDNKLISLVESIKLDKLIDVLDKLLPNNTWKEFTIQTNVIVNWSNPIVITQPNYWWHPPYYAGNLKGGGVLFNSNTNTSSAVIPTVTNGTYNLEIKD